MDVNVAEWQCIAMWVCEAPYKDKRCQLFGKALDHIGPTQTARISAIITRKVNENQFPCMAGI